MPDNTRVVLFAGTERGLYALESDLSRRDWRPAGAHLLDAEVTGLLADARACRIVAGVRREAEVPTVAVGEDLGRTWSTADGPRFRDGGGRHLRRVWHLIAQHEPDAYFAGVDEAGLFASRDGGRSWHRVDSLDGEPTRPRWSRTSAGNPLHSIVLDTARPERLWALVGGAGVVRSDNGGADWEFRNGGLTATGGRGELVAGVHRLVADTARTERLYLQTTEGTFASDDGAEHWERIDAGLPSRFGFALDVSAAGDVFVLPLDGRTRQFPEGRMQVYRRRREGCSWQPLGDALPSDPHRAGVLRDALAVDALDPPGLYFGTTQGDLFVSPDGGSKWMRLPGSYPRVHTVRVGRFQ